MGSQCVVAGLGAAPAGRVGGSDDSPALLDQRAVAVAGIANEMLAHAGFVPSLLVVAVAPAGDDDVLSVGRGEGCALLELGVFKGEGHGSQVGVEAFASCPHILHHAQPWSTQVSNGSTQLRCRLAARLAGMQRQR